MTPRRDPKRSSDEELIAAMRQGEKAALGVLYERHVDRVYALACRMLGMRRPAEEVVTVAFEFAWSHRAAYGADRGSVRAWLLGIAHEKAVDVLRGLDSAGDPSQEPADLAESDVAADEFVSTRAGNREDAPALLDALAGVPPEQSRVIELAYFGGYNQSEIAEMLEVPADIVKRRMRAALEHLDRVFSEGD